ncbi:MAG: FAD-dependent oxidoreductase [Candidatus Eremiobacterota bacterium]
MISVIFRAPAMVHPGAMHKKKVVIVGGVAGGASCAARLRRLDERAEIVVLERGPYASFANCGLPYYVGDVIEQESNLLVATPELFRDRFAIRVLTGHEVTAVHREAREVEVCASGESFRMGYDALVLAPGAYPVRPPLPGVDREGVFSVRSIPDSRRIRSWIEDRKVARAVIVGGGFIGLEMAESLVRRGLQVSVVEMLPQVMPPLDPEMAVPVADELRRHGVELVLGDALASIREDLTVVTASGHPLPADLVVLALGVRPETTLARQAGLELGPRGGIRVDAGMRTSDPNIWAVGDAVEVTDVVTGEPVCIPLAGPANRQGRLAAESICGRTRSFRGVQGTAIVGVFDLAVAATGASEKTLRRVGAEHAVVYLHPGHHAGYYPGARRIALKLLFRPSDGRILGAQAVGEEGVDKRIDVISTAIQLGGTVFDLEESELCYAPQFGSAKDPVNLAGMIAANVCRGDLRLARWEDLETNGVPILDVREPAEFAQGHLQGAFNVPLGQLRKRLDEVPASVRVCCGVGQRAYYACRLLLQHGRQAALLPGGWRTYQDLLGSGILPSDGSRESGVGSDQRL